MANSSSSMFDEIVSLINEANFAPIEEKLKLLARVREIVFHRDTQLLGDVIPMIAELKVGLHVKVRCFILQFLEEALVFQSNKRDRVKTSVVEADQTLLYLFETLHFLSHDASANVLKKVFVSFTRFLRRAVRTIIKQKKPRAGDSSWGTRELPKAQGEGLDAQLWRHIRDFVLHLFGGTLLPEKDSRRDGRKQAANVSELGMVRVSLMAEIILSFQEMLPVGEQKASGADITQAQAPQKANSKLLASTLISILRLLKQKPQFVFSSLCSTERLQNGLRMVEWKQWRVEKKTSDLVDEIGSLLKSSRLLNGVQHIAPHGEDYSCSEREQEQEQERALSVAHASQSLHTSNSSVASRSAPIGNDSIAFPSPPHTASAANVADSSAVQSGARHHLSSTFSPVKPVSLGSTSPREDRGYLHQRQMESRRNGDVTDESSERSPEGKVQRSLQRPSIALRASTNILFPTSPSQSATNRQKRRRSKTEDIERHAERVRRDYASISFEGRGRELSDPSQLEVIGTTNTEDNVKDHDTFAPSVDVIPRSGTVIVTLPQQEDTEAASSSSPPLSYVYLHRRLAIKRLLSTSSTSALTKPMRELKYRLVARLVAPSLSTLSKPSLFVPSFLLEGSATVSVLLHSDQQECTQNGVEHKELVRTLEVVFDHVLEDIGNRLELVLALLYELYKRTFIGSSSGEIATSTSSLSSSIYEQIFMAFLGKWIYRMRSKESAAAKGAAQLSSSQPFPSAKPEKTAFFRLLDAAPIVSRPIVSFLLSLLLPQAKEQGLQRTSSPSSPFYTSLAVASVTVLVQQKSTLSHEYLQILLQLTVEGNQPESVREKAVHSLVYNVYCPLLRVEDQYKKKLDRVKSSATSFHSTEKGQKIETRVIQGLPSDAVSESEEEGAAGHSVIHIIEAFAKDCLIGRKSSKDLPFTSKESGNCPPLFLVLCGKRASLLRNLFKIVQTMKIEVDRQSLLSHIPVLMAELEEKVKCHQIIGFFREVLPFKNEQIVSLCLRMVEALSELHRAVDPELLLFIKEISQSEIDSKEQPFSLVRFAIPVMKGMSTEEIRTFFPRLMLLDDNNLSRALLELAAIAERDPQSLSQIDIVEMTHVETANVPLKSQVQCQKILFGLKSISTSSVLSACIQRLAGRKPIPSLMMRTILLTLNAYPETKDAIGDALSIMLLNDEVWQRKEIWEGFKRCVKLIPEQSARALEDALLLPSEKRTECIALLPPRWRGILQATATTTS